MGLRIMNNVEALNAHRTLQNTNMQVSRSIDAIVHLRREDDGRRRVTEIAEVVESCGLRALISATAIDQRSPDAESADDSLAKGNGFIERWLDRNPRITPIFGPHANYTLNAEQLAATRAHVAQAEAMLADQGLRLAWSEEGDRYDDRVPAGHILMQRPRAGTLVKRGRAVTVVLHMCEGHYRNQASDMQA